MMQYASQDGLFPDFRVRKLPTITYKRKQRAFPPVSTWNPTMPSSSSFLTPPTVTSESRNTSASHDSAEKSTVTTENNPLTVFQRLRKELDNAVDIFGFPSEGDPIKRRQHENEEQTNKILPNNVGKSKESSVFDIFDLPDPSHRASQHLDIFDLPPEDGHEAEVKLLVATSRDAPAQSTSPAPPRKTYQKATKHAKLKAIPPQSIYPSASNHSSATTSPQKTYGKRKAKAVEHHPSYHQTPIHPISPSAHQVLSTCSMLMTRTPQEIVPSSPSSSTSSSSSNSGASTAPKRKLNLISRLKSASGESTDIDRNRWYEFSDDDDGDESAQDESNLASPKTTPKNDFGKEPSPELSYQERMERELSSLMRSEFDEENEASTIQASTPRHNAIYTPDKCNVRITYSRSTRIQHST
ncbi:uncharacterized protein BYT42DRAFT_551942 [Radiomyces spectabilis]|uniref:uncharacterized protein n=1 Tax=Radiomyces spectabilis TaxID=64574 RepID=UPI00221E5188|nr:uncharacterized protein BYT42DRAFT_551942 [Radiomyces spectabilis]KAI8393701.1 hypothetical protein BYT42DRAFT_551942 [Radiomyces spectabilis]